MPPPRSSTLTFGVVAALAFASLLACSGNGSGGASGGGDWYYHWNCNGDYECLTTNSAGTPAGVSDVGPVESNCTSLLLFASKFWGPAAVNWCDQSAGGNGPLVSLRVTPASATIAVGLTQQYTATGVYAGGATVDLTSKSSWTAGSGVVHIGAPPVATISAGGLATAEATGTIAIQATYAGLSGSATLSVSGAKLESITVSPATPSVKQGLTQQLSATGHYSDGSAAPLPGATWASDASTVATVDANGLTKAMASGTATMTATYQGVSGSTLLTVVALQTITVGPASPSVPAGRSLQLTATGAYADGTTADLTSAVTWSSGTTAVATVSAGGAARGVVPGTSLFTGTFGSVSGSATLTVSAAVLESLAVTPSTRTTAVGGQQQYAATARFSDGTSVALAATAVTWTSSTPGSGTAAATIDTSGIATAVAPGTAFIGATYDGVGGGATLTVVALGTHWDVGSASTTATLSAITSTGSQVVAVGSGGAIITSPDGLSWTTRSSGTTASLTGVAWSGSLLVAVGNLYSGSPAVATPVILTSTDGVGWTSETTPVTMANPLLSVAWGGGQFVIGGYDGLFTSPDGVSWTKRAGATYWASAVTWTGTQFVAVGYSVFTSPDGVSWSAAATPADHLHGIVWTGAELVAVGGATTVGSPGAIVTSPNASTLSWTDRPAGTTATLQAVAWSASGSVLAAVGNSSSTGYGDIVTSPDGITWTEQAPGTTEALQAITWSGSRFVAVGTNGVVLTSP